MFGKPTIKATMTSKESCPRRPRSSSSTARADETGFYELETIHPGYYTGRTKHIHYLIQHPGYKKLVTQLYFKGDPRNPADPLFRESLAIEIATQRLGGTPVELGHFDIVLSPAATEV